MRVFILSCLFFVLFLNYGYGQKTVKFGYVICESEVQSELILLYGKDLAKNHFRLNKELSYSFCVDYENFGHHKLSYQDSDSLKIVPYEYVLLYEIIDDDANIISTFRMNCSYSDRLLRLDPFPGLREYLSPQIKVLEGKTISLKEVLLIAKRAGYKNIIEWDIDYEKNKKRHYKWFFPRLVWTLKEEVSKVDNEGRVYGYKKVITINAKNGRVLNQYEEFDL